MILFLRFPRVEKVRDASDKPWHSCMTTQELETLRKEGEGKLTKRRLDGDPYDDGDDDEDPREAKKRRRKQAAGSSRQSQMPAGVSSHYRSADLSQIMVETHDLKGKVVVVEPAGDSNLKTRLEAIVTKLGGTCEQNVRAGHTHLYVETGFKIRARSEAKGGKVDVVRSGWLIECDIHIRLHTSHNLLVKV